MIQNQLVSKLCNKKLLLFLRNSRGCISKTVEKGLNLTLIKELLAALNVQRHCLHARKQIMSLCKT